MRILIRHDNVAIMGGRLGTAFNYSSHGLHFQDPARDGGASDAGGSVPLTVSGVFRRPMAHELEPTSDLQKRAYARHVRIGGTVDALVCPSDR